MKKSDRTILLAVLAIVALGAVWFGLIAPKRSELSKLNEDVETAQAEVTEAEQLATAATAAKENYRADYEQLIVLGKAAPADDDVASLMDQIDGLAKDAGVEFSGLKLSQETGGADAALAAPATTAPTEEAPAGEEGGDEETPAPPEGVVATETAVAGLPLGATVGPAGLPIMPYDLTFTGTFFDIADFMAGVDKLVRVQGDGVGVDGRLLTVDGFTLVPDANAGFPTLVASLHVTAFVAPADQGAAAGADPAAPAPTTPPPAAGTTPAATPAVATP